MVRNSWFVSSACNLAMKVKLRAVDELATLPPSTIDLPDLS